MVATAAADFQIRMSVDEVESATKLARSEIAKLGSLQRQAKTDAERLAEGLDLVERALKEERITAEEALRVSTHLTEKYKQETKAVHELADAHVQAAAQHSQALNAANIGVANEKLRMLQGAFQAVTIEQNKSNDALIAHGKSIADSFAQRQEQIESTWKSASASKAASIESLALKGSLVAVGMAASGYAIIDKWADSLGRIADAHDVAKTLGESYSAIQNFSQAVSEVAGVSFDGAIAGLRQMQNVVGAAASGNGKSQKLLEQLGLTAGDLSSLGAVEQFNLINEALGKIEDRSKRVALATKLFGDALFANAAGGDDLTSTLRDVDSQFSKLTATQLKAADTVSDAWGRMKRWARNEWNSTMATLAVGITGTKVVLDDMADATNNVAIESQKLEEQLLKEAEALKQAEQEKVDAIRAAEDEANRIQQKFYAESEQQLKRLDELRFGADEAKNRALKREGLDEYQRDAILRNDAKIKELEEQKKARDEEEKHLDSLMKAGDKIRKQFAAPVERIKQTVAEMTELVSVNALSIVDAEREINRIILEQQKRRQNDGKSSTVQTLKLSDAGAYSQLTKIWDEQRKAESSEQKKLQAQQQANALLEQVVQNTARIQPMGRIR